MRLCRHCGERLPKEATSCPVCAPKRKKKQQARQEPEITLKALKSPPSKTKAEAKTAQHVGSDPKTKICPECGEAVPKASKFCFSCGLIFFTTPAKPERPVTAQEVKKKNPYLKKVVFFSFLFVATALGFQVFHHEPPGMSNLEQSLSVFPIDDGTFDQTLQLPSQHSGVAWNGEEFVFTTKTQPPEFLRITPDGNTYNMQRIQTPDLRQRGMAVLSLTWNGKEYVGYAESGLFAASKDHLFTIHDAQNLELKETHSAPANIGGLAWDGAGYWAASRVIDPESNEKAYLYRLNRDFEIINKLKSITNDCRGLAWDGEFLWYVDGSSGRVFVLNVRGVGSSIVRQHKTDMDSLGAIAFDGETAWVIGEQRNRFYRMLPDPTLHPREVGTPAMIASVEDTGTPDSDQYIGSSKYPNNDVEVNEFSCRIIENDLLASWSVHAGEDLFDKPVLATLTIVAQSETQQRPITRVVDLRQGINRANSQIIGEDLQPGAYRIGLFLYVQYKQGDGANRILTKSIRTLRVTN